MKRFTKICLITGVVLLICGAAATSTGCIAGALRDIRHASGNSPDAKRETQIIYAENFANMTLLDIDLTAEDVTFGLSPDENGHIYYTPVEGWEYHFGYAAAEGPSSCYFYSGSVGTGGWPLMSFNFSSIYTQPVQVLLPEELSVPIDVCTTSGDIRMEGLSVGDVRFSSTSGDISISASSLNALTVSATSGQAEIDDTTVTRQGKVSTISGDIKLHSAAMGGLSCNSTSGDVRASALELEDKLHVSTTSGEVAVSKALVPGNVDVDTTSGDVELELQGAPPHKISTSTTAGTTHVSGGDDNGAHTISVHTTSGDIRIQDGA